VDRIVKLKEFLAAQPGDNFLEHALALEYIKLGDDSTARSLFEAILERQPGYVGSYYHLGKLLERQGENDGAVKVYETGMAECKKVKDNHPYNELQGAWEDLTEV
jgi:tetratricopeptide (TPR) repeat protein